MATTLIASRPRGRPAHTPGTTRCAYTPDGTKLVTVGDNNLVRIYKTGYDGEPTNIDDCQEQNLAVSVGNEFFLTGSEDGTVSLFSLATCTFDRLLYRTGALAVRDLALSPDNQYCAVASDELTVKLINTTDNTDVRPLKEHGKPAKHLAFHPKGTLLAISCTDGVIYIYSLTSESPELIHRLDGVIGRIESESEISTKVVWHPDGRAFAAPTPVGDIQVISKNDWEKQRSFSSEHEGQVTALAWSPNGALLASAAKDRKIVLWATKDQSVMARFEYPNVIDISWHPTQNLASFTTSEGEVYIAEDFVPEQFSGLLTLPLQPAPFIHDPLTEISTHLRRPEINGLKPLAARPGSDRGDRGDRGDRRDRRDRRESLASLDDFLEESYGGDDEDFVVDDDGAGYTTGRKRPAMDDDSIMQYPNKRRNLFSPEYHPSFQPGSTPWRGNRKYLCLNLIGSVWTVDQDSHHTVTVQFYDKSFQKDFHFTDTSLYDQACLGEQGTLFSCPPKEKAAGKAPAVVSFRPHETWTVRKDWRMELPGGEAVLAMSLSHSFIIVTTTGNLVRVFTLFGIPYRVYRPKSTPVVTCASWRDYVLTVGNGAVRGDGYTKLVYTIENVKLGEICQNEDTVALPAGVTLKSVFFSDLGDPCIYDSTGTLLTLLHWRRPSRATWIPLLDTRLLPRLASGAKQESYFPIAVADGKFHCIILKGGDQYPYFPAPMLSEFDFLMPLHPTGKIRDKKNKTSDEDVGIDQDEDLHSEPEDDDAETRRLEHAFVLGRVRAAQMADLVDASPSSASQQAMLARAVVDVNKTLIQMLAIECREDESRGMRALELVKLMRDPTGRMLEAAGKVAERYGRTILGEKIREIGEDMAAEEDEEVDMDV